MRRIIDDRGRLFGRISVIDVIVIIVVVVLVVGGLTKFVFLDTAFSSRDTAEVTYKFRIGSVRETNVNLLREGDRLYSYETGAFVGTIIHKEVTPAVITDTVVDGSMVTASVEDRYDVVLTIVADGSFSNDRYYIGRTFELRTNATFRVISKYNDVSGADIAIE